jgi:hypothetical protein
MTGQDLIFCQRMSENSTMVRSEKKSSLLVIAMSWLVVLLPLGWGVFQSVVKSLPLLSASPALEKSRLVR